MDESIKYITNWKILGFPIYQRIRILDEAILIYSPPKEFSYPGLMVLGYDPQLTYSFSILFRKKRWDKIANTTIALTLFNLLINKHLELRFYEDTYKVFNGWFQFQRDNYYLTNMSNTQSRDLLSNTIRKSVLVSTKVYKQKRSLDEFVRIALDSYLSNQEHQRPAKSFVIRNLNRYANEIPEITIDKKTKILGLIKNYSVKIEKNFKVELVNDYKEINQLMFREVKNNKAFGRLLNKLYSELESDFRGREPSDDID